MRNIDHIALIALASAAFVAQSGAAWAQTGTITSGYVLTHEHPMYGMAFGGNYAFAGAPGNYRNGIMENGYTGPCGGCYPMGTCNHGEVKGGLTALSGSLGGDMGDHASHMGPLHNSNSHLRYSTQWIHEAFDPEEPEFAADRMKIMVALAVEAEAMCEQLYDENTGGGGAGGAGYACTQGDSWPSLIRQLDAIKAWVADNPTWMEIAYSASDARRIVLSGKLAIILGIESEYSFGAEDSTFDPVQRLTDYYEQGVRTFYLAHKINSRLSGADIYLPQGTAAGKALRAVQAISGCYHYDDHVGDFPLRGRFGKHLCNNGRTCGDDAFRGGKIGDSCTYALGDISEANMIDYVMLRGASGFNGFNIYPLPPGFDSTAVSFTEANRAGSTGGDTSDDTNVERNNLGLSHDGERVMREAMRMGMIVNLDHVSSKARRHIRTLSSGFGDYPLNAMHNKPNSRLTGDHPPHEYDFDDAEIDMIADTHGFFGLRMGPTDSVEYSASGITADCPNTSTESGKMLAWLLDRDVNVGYSLDYATVTKGVHSRTLEGCELVQTDDRLHQYGTHLAEGLSHVGMMKKWHKELEAVGMASRYLTKLRNDGAEAFVRMWELSEAKASLATQIPRRTFTADPPGDPCAEDSNCMSSEYCSRMGWDPRANECTDKKLHGVLCSDARQCVTDRCAWGFCADADECLSHTDCGGTEYCGDPLGGKRSCKALKAHGALCTSASQCATNRCSWGFCADADECLSNTDCGSTQYCGDPVAGKRSCKALKPHGAGCTAAAQCATGRCSWGFCADPDECLSNTDCASGQYCGDPILGKRSCKALKSRGQACTRSIQCRSGRCRLFQCK